MLTRQPPCADSDLQREHSALLAGYAKAQDRCSRLLRLQASEIERLQAQVLRLSAALVVRTTMLAWSGEGWGGEADLLEAGLVICQTGCMSHGAYWLVEDHCRRTRKPCVMIGQPSAPHAFRLLVQVP